MGQSRPAGGDVVRLQVPSPGLYTLTLQMREDGLRVDRLLLTTDTTYVPPDTGPTETVSVTVVKVPKMPK